MFVAQDLTLDVAPAAAQARLANLLGGNWLAGVSGAAYDGGLTGLLRVGPAGPAAGKLVRVGFLAPIYRDDVMSVGLRWEATGPAGSLFPALDADITISSAEEQNAPAVEGSPPAAGQQSARLALTGSYRPPLGWLGAGLDQVVLHRVATATMHALLHSVAEAVTIPATAGHAAPSPSPGWRPMPQTSAS
jgi:hypothetical protein